MARTKNTYSVPFSVEVKAISDPRAHFAHFRYAIDFLLPVGTQLLATAAGKVIDIKIDSRVGGPESKYNDIRFLNYMTLEHVNGEYSQYGHLGYNGNLVRLGERIKRGQPIALSGNTGFTTAPHLHFQVFKNNKTAIGWETLEIRFNEKIYVNRGTESAKTDEVRKLSGKKR